MLNIFLGWSFVGWIVALVWAASNDTQNQSVIINNSVSSDRTSNHLVTPTYQNESFRATNSGKSLNDLYRERLSNKETLNQHNYNLKENVPTQNNVSQLDKISHLKELKELLDNGVLTQEEFEKEKNKILNT